MQHEKGSQQHYTNNCCLLSFFTLLNSSIFLSIVWLILYVVVFRVMFSVLCSKVEKNVYEQLCVSCPTVKATRIWFAVMQYILFDKTAETWGTSHICLMTNNQQQLFFLLSFCSVALCLCNNSLKIVTLYLRFTLSNTITAQCADDITYTKVKKMKTKTKQIQHSKQLPGIHKFEKEPTVLSCSMFNCVMFIRIFGKN